MRGILGWIREEETVGSTLEPSQNARYAAIRAFPFWVVTKCCALGASAKIHTDDMLVTVMDGHPEWTDSRMARIARDRGDSYALAAAYHKNGLDCLAQVEGDFAAVIVREGGPEVILAIDRIGLQSLVYAPIPEGRAFASTLDALGSAPGISRELEPQAIYEYVLFHVIPSPLTIYHQHSKIIPGQYVRLSMTESERQWYWRPAFGASRGIPERKLAEDLLFALEDAVRRRVVNGATTGCFLSGGLDSSTIAGFLARHGSASSTAFSIGFEEQGYDETDYVRSVAKAFGIKSHVSYVDDKDVVAAAAEVATAFDEPFGNASAVPVYYCATRAQEHGISTLLAGDGGDELFGGNSRYAKQLLLEKYKAIPPPIRRWLLEPGLRLLGTGTEVGALAKIKSYVRQANVELPQRLQAYNHVVQAQITEILVPELVEHVDAGQPFAVWKEVFDRPVDASPLERTLFLDWKHTLADNDLRKVSVMCQKAGVEVRYPMLDSGVVNLAMKLPQDYKVRYSELRPFYKHTVRKLLPHKVLTKRKHGFGLPYGLWLKRSEDLQGLTYDALSCLKSRGWFEPSWIDDMIHRHREVHAVLYGPTLWALLMLELWMEGKRL